MKEEAGHERTQKEKMNREKDKFMADKFRLEGELGVWYSQLQLSLSMGVSVSRLRGICRCLKNVGSLKARSRNSVI